MIGPMAHPIRSIFDARLMGITNMASTPGAFSNGVLNSYAWVRAYMANGRHDDLIERARFELPPPRWVWLDMGEVSFDGHRVPEMAHAVAADAGWSMQALKENTGITTWRNTYAHLVTLIRTTIQQEAVRREAYSWRSYVAQSKRAAMEEDESR